MIVRRRRVREQTPLHVCGGRGGGGTCRTWVVFNGTFVRRRRLREEGEAGGGKGGRLAWGVGRGRDVSWRTAMGTSMRWQHGHDGVSAGCSHRVFVMGRVEVMVQRPWWMRRERTRNPRRVTQVRVVYTALHPLLPLPPLPPILLHPSTRPPSPAPAPPSVRPPLHALIVLCLIPHRPAPTTPPSPTPTAASTSLESPPTPTPPLSPPPPPVSGPVFP